MPSRRNGSHKAAKNAHETPPKKAEVRSSRFSPSAYFHDRTVLITGASSGIGRDLALSFAKMGAKVALIARRQPPRESLAEEILVARGEALPLVADVTHRSELRDAVDLTLAHFNRTEVLVNSAGIAISNRVENMPPEDLESMMAVNLMGTLHTACGYSIGPPAIPSDLDPRPDLIAVGAHSQRAYLIYLPLLQR